VNELQTHLLLEPISSSTSLSFPLTSHEHVFTKFFEKTKWHRLHKNIHINFKHSQNDDISNLAHSPPLTLQKWKCKNIKAPMKFIWAPCEDFLWQAHNMATKMFELKFGWKNGFCALLNHNFFLVDLCIKQTQVFDPYLWTTLWIILLRPKMIFVYYMSRFKSA
jgi:hypothetical protein